MRVNQLSVHWTISCLVGRALCTSASTEVHLAILGTDIFSKFQLFITPKREHVSNIKQLLTIKVWIKMTNFCGVNKREVYAFRKHAVI